MTARTRTARSRPEFDERALSRQILQIAHAADPDERRRLAAAVADHAVRSGILKSWTEVFLAKGQALGANDETTALMSKLDVQQIVAESLLTRLIAVTPADYVKVQKWSGWLFMKAREAIRDKRESSEYTYASGMVTLLRRRKINQTLTGQLTRDLGREPTPAEVIAASKRRGTEASRRRAAIELTLADFDDAAVTPMAVTADGGDPFADLPSDGETPEDAAQESESDANARKLAAELLERALALAGAAGGPVPAELGTVGAAWLDLVLEGVQQPRTAELTERTGLERRLVDPALKRWRTLLVQARAQLTLPAAS